MGQNTIAIQALSANSADALSTVAFGVIYPSAYITGGAGTLGSPWTHSALPIVDGSVIEYGAGHWFAQLHITASHVSVIGKGADCTFLHSVSGNTVIEYDTGDAAFSRFFDFALVGPGKTDAGGKHGIYMHDMSIAPHSVVVQRVFVRGFAGDGIRLGKPGATDTGNAFYACGVYDSWVDGCGGHCYSLINFGPTSVFFNCVGVEIPNNKFGLYSEEFQGVISAFGGCDNILPVAGSGSSVDGGGQLRIATSANVEICGCNFENAGQTFVDLSGCSGVVSFKNNTFLDQNVKEAVANRIAVQFTVPSLLLTFSGNQFNTATQWLDNVPLHGVSSGRLMSFDVAINQISIGGTVLAISAMQAGYDTVLGYFNFLPLLKSKQITVDSPPGAPLVLLNNGTPVFYLNSDSATNNQVYFGGHNAFQMFNSTLYLGHNSDITIQSDSPVKFAANVGFSGSAPIAKPTVTGSKLANAALASLLTALSAYGLITDSST